MRSIIFLCLLTSFALFGCTTLQKKCVFHPANPDGVDRDDILCAMERDVVPKARECYEVILHSEDPDYTQRVITRFELAPMGKAQGITIEPADVRPKFATCISDALGAAQFPTHTSAKPVKVLYPFLFRRSGH